jgi:serine-type D-Ala-D-Ala carboxypeptidase (penicillin-binding protein 5/6)
VRIPPAARIPDLREPVARLRRELRRISRPAHGFWGSRLSLLTGLTLAGVGVFGAAVWALASGAPRADLDGTVVAGASQQSDPSLVRSIAADFVYPGGSPRLAWPSSGRAAVEVEGFGLMGSHGPMTAQAPIASITKTMTAYVVLEDHPLRRGQSGPTITVTPSLAKLYGEAIAEDESAVELHAGEHLTELQALDAMMLASAGDVADLLAIWDRGSVSAFADEMNRQARTLGMTGTDYTDPTGLAASTVSTMADQLTLAEAVQKVPALTSIVAQGSAYVPVVGTIQNINRDLGTLGIDGIKTGTTAAAGSCLLFSAHVKVGGHTVTLLGIVLGLPGSTGTPWAALKAAGILVDSAEKALGTATVAAAHTPVAALVQNGHKTAELGVSTPLTVVGWPGLRYRVAVSDGPGGAQLTVTRTGASSYLASEPLRTLPAPAKAGRKPSGAARSTPSGGH